MTRLSAEQIGIAHHNSHKTPDANLLEVPDKIVAHYIYENLAVNRSLKKLLTSKEVRSEIKRISSKLEDNQNFGRYSRTGKLMRASEGRSPADSGSLLHIFGQSSREITDDTKKEANIPQALALLNDDQFSFNKISTYDLIQKTSDKEGKRTYLYFSTLS